MTDSTGGRHRAPEPAPPTSSGGGLAAWLAFCTVVAIVAAVVGVLTGSSIAWGIVIIDVVVAGLSAWIFGTAQPVSPRVKREAAYVGRTAERATVWYAVWRVLGGIFGR